MPVFRSRIDKIEKELTSQISKFYADPLGFVLFSYPWGKPGPIQQFSGPERWQQNFLDRVGQQVRARRFDGRHAVAPLRFTRSSGHGIGKSTMAAWLINWILSTRPDSQGTITANTFPQLQSKTWAQVTKWTQLCITSHWFHLTGQKVAHKDNPATWFCASQTCREENSEAFAGQHAVSSTSFYLFDESSAVPDKIYEVAEGGLTDGEPMIFLFGNPTRRTGKFFRINFGSESDKWDHAAIDSRECSLTNKQQIAEWENDYGENSDFVRVRVRGLPPTASDAQFIDMDRIYAAQRRTMEGLQDDPLIIGIDVARGGADKNVIAFRKGLDAKCIPAIKLPGEETRDTTVMVAKVADVMDRYKPQAVFLDATGIGGPIADRLKTLGYNVHEVGFGDRSPDSKYSDMRSYMWGRLREWLEYGSIPSDVQLEQDLSNPGYGHDKKDRVKLESKESMKNRGVGSPDDGDALALTFALPVALKGKSKKSGRRSGRRPTSWMSS